MGKNIAIKSANGNHRIIFIAGIPGTGKSYFGDWLRLNHNFVHISLENAQPRRSTGIYDAWDHFISTHDTLPLFGILHEHRQDVVMDWGFPAHCLPMVAELKQAGAELWWLDGETVTARSQFIQRNTKPIQDFYAQVPEIRLAWSAISKVFGTNYIKVLEADRPRLTCEEIWKRMNEHAI